MADLQRSHSAKSYIFNSREKQILAVNPAKSCIASSESKKHKQETVDGERMTVSRKKTNPNWQNQYFHSQGSSEPRGIYFLSHA